ncbi:hypothetical protein SLEP1_g39139 [Rubroshorea leprosula]|uniref:TAFII55 protein conserved region domain-containing protein n=1 Tax=Rubroshorea leprosula TaxID=152421 RepID=A0AAV5KZP7_9ROSI|nr:hypothetical protein SLEP1_g39139 [Rubroshorea leprosula]
MEEQFILRVPPSLAERLNQLLSENDSSSEDKSLDLSFSEDGQNGTFVIGNDHFPASLLDLPCVVESFKTYDDSALVKTADIGQMIMVREPGDASPDMVEYRHGLTPPMRDARKRRFRREPDLNSFKTYDDSALVKTADIGQMIMVREPGDASPDMVEYRHGLTPPMRDARKRRFRREPDLNVSITVIFQNIANSQKMLILTRKTCCDPVYELQFASRLKFYFNNCSDSYLPELVQRAEKDLVNIMSGGTGKYVVNEQVEDAEGNARNTNKKAPPVPESKPDVPDAVANNAEPERSESDDSDDSI